MGFLVLGLVGWAGECAGTGLTLGWAAASGPTVGRRQPILGCRVCSLPLACLWLGLSAPGRNVG